MPSSVLRICFLLLLSTSTLAGCGYFQKADSAADDEFADFDKDEKAEEEADGKATSKNGSKVVEGELELKLQVGDRFPFQKRIEQRLTQGDGLGGMIVNRSLVEMMLSLVVDEIRDGNKLLTVRYHKIHYGHNIAGRTVEYNSESSAAVPTEALVYSGLKNNGFSFWIGPDNRVVELVGFPDFLQRCVQNVPAAHRDVVMRQLEGTHGEDGLSNFVDDGIGLLPYSNDPAHPAVAVKVGSSWDLKRRSESGAPISIVTRCVLKNLTESAAEITLLGKISGSGNPVALPDSNRNGMQVMVKGGHCAGACTIDRKTGLPKQSEVNRYLELVVKLPDGAEIPQRKEVLTTTVAFLDQGPARETAAVSRDAEPGTLRASAFGSESGRVTQAFGQTESFEDRRSDTRGRGGAERSSFQR